ncbi:hypothetical protein [Aquimarina sp. AU58]|uniref:hypothetical protein n=1 Tax=Aquimarina sp. AU58 TaxID=1874112 RepID=UPI00135CCF96|nr:hypothetical protein [Aquimarina sp. AU58]
MKNGWIIILFFLSQSMFGQEKYMASIPTLGFSVTNNVFYYTKYPEGFKVYADCNSVETCKNKYPESTLQSILSSKNYEWNQNNYEYKIKNDSGEYEKKNKHGKEELYAELLNKVTFKANGHEFAIIKYHFKTNNKKTPACITLKKKNDQWFVYVATRTMAKVYMMFNYLSSDSIDAIFMNKKTNMKSLDSQIAEMYASGILDFSKAIHSENSGMTQEELKKVLDPLMIQQYFGMN